MAVGSVKYAVGQFKSGQLEYVRQALDSTRLVTNDKMVHEQLPCEVLQFINERVRPGTSRMSLMELRSRKKLKQAIVTGSRGDETENCEK